MKDKEPRIHPLVRAGSALSAISLAVSQAGCRVSPTISPDTTTASPTSTETVPPNNFPIATDTTEVSSYGQYDFIEQSEIEANLKEPYEHFKNNPDVKALFNDPGTIEYSAMGIKVYLQGGGHTNYIFFEASSETEEKGYIAMVFGGGQPGEISYSVLNRIVDSNGMVGLGLTSDIDGNQLENPVMIFNTGLTEKEISQLTADDLLKRDLLFIPGGIKVPSERIIGAKVLFFPIPIEPTPTETLPPLPSEFLTLEDWREVFRDITLGDYTIDVFNYSEYVVLTEPEQVRRLQVGTQLMILNPSGEITVFANPDEAAVRAEGGAVVIAVDRNEKRSSIVVAVAWAINAAFRQYQQGNRNIYVRFGSYDTRNPAAGGEISISSLWNPYITDKNGRKICPWLEKPLYFLVEFPDGRGGRPEKFGVTDLEYWLDELIKQGYSEIVIHPNQASYEFIAGFYP